MKTRGDQSVVIMGKRSMDSLVADWAQWKPPPPKEDEIPKGWISIDEFAKVRKCSISTASKILADGLATGALEVRNFKRLTNKMGLRPVKHFRQTSGKSR